MLAVGGGNHVRYKLIRGLGSCMWWAGEWWGVCPGLCAMRLPQRMFVWADMEHWAWLHLIETALGDC